MTEGEVSTVTVLGAQNYVAFSPDGKTIAAAYSGFRRDREWTGGLVLWDLASRKRLIGEPLAVKEGSVGSVAFSPDGKIIAAGYQGDNPRESGLVLWDVAAHKRLVAEPLAVQEGFVTGVAFSPDGKTIAAGYGRPNARGGGVVLWELATRKHLIAEPLSMEEAVQSVTFSPDGKTIAAGCTTFRRLSGGVLLWDVDLESWQRRAGQIASRNFTWQEWREYFHDEPYDATFPDLPVPPEANPN
jgi:WD40 repeat protein